MQVGRKRACALTLIMKRARDPFDQINAQHLIAKAVVSRRARRHRKRWGWPVKQAKPSHWQWRHCLTAIVCSQRNPPTRRLWLKQRGVEQVKRADYQPRLAQPVARGTIKFAKHRLNRAPFSDTTANNQLSNQRANLRRRIRCVTQGGEC